MHRSHIISGGAVVHKSLYCVVLSPLQCVAALLALPVFQSMDDSGRKAVVFN